MKVGRTLSEVAAEIERQAETKHDYIADTRQLRLDDDGHTLSLDGHGIFQTKDLALTQIGAHAGIPVPYMRRMQTEAPELLLRGLVASGAPRSLKEINVVDIVIDPERSVLQDGRTAQEFLEELFEYEYCAECGGDTEDHIVVFDPLGLFHAYCLKPLFL